MLVDCMLLSFTQFCSFYWVLLRSWQLLCEALNMLSRQVFNLTASRVGHPLHQLSLDRAAGTIPCDVSHDVRSLSSEQPDVFWDRTYTLVHVERSQLETLLIADMRTVLSSRDKQNYVVLQTYIPLILTADTKKELRQY